MINDFLNPKTIAVIGASENNKKVGGVIMDKLKIFKGNVIPINPAYNFIFGKKCYSSVEKFSKTINLAIIATPSITIPSILKKCYKKKIKSVIIISAGFSEQGNFKLEEKIKKIAKKYQIRILGPNCFGIANPHLNLDLTFSNLSAKKGDVAFISQSGALWSFAADISASSKIGFSGFVSLGNMADLSFNEFIDYFEKDKKTRKIILYVERLEHGKKFIDLCKRCKKQITVIKAGSSEQGSKAAISHTGSLATEFKVYQGAFRQAEIIQEEFLCSALKISPQKAKEISIKGEKTILLTNAGGAGALLADYCEKKGLKLITLKESNPLDILGTAEAKDYEEAIKKINKKYNYDLLMVVLTPQRMSEPEETVKKIIKNCNKRKTITYLLGENSIKKAGETLDKHNFIYFNRIKNSLEKLRIKK